MKSYVLKVIVNGGAEYIERYCTYEAILRLAKKLQAVAIYENN